MVVEERALTQSAAAMPGPSSRTDLVAELFVRGLGVVYAVAFASLASQIVGLVGERGIAPASELLAERELPTWLWWTGASNGALYALCAAGGVCSLALIAGPWPRVALFGAWSLYLSFSAVGDVFLSYQWDALLLESALVGLLVATPGAGGPWLARLLCLKLMLLSGIVKLRSGDPTWRDLSALSYHFWTQPLPAWPALLAQQLPRAVLAALTAATLGSELVAPIAIFGPRRLRLIAAGLLALLQLVIAATGSYGFFNLLSLLLCASLLDDDALFARCPARLQPFLRRLQARRSPPSGLRRALACSLAAALCLASLIVSAQRLVPLPAAAHAAVRWLRPLRSINSYGLFAVMTTTRHEIALEGSRDGEHFVRYRFPWKPDRLDRRPRFSTPHMPRLDWQMWFAALGRCEQQPWLLALFKRVLEGSPDVLGLFAENPFPDAPPRFLRTPQADYHFAPPSAWLHGVYWVSEPLPDYCPPVTLHDGQLVRAR